MSDVLEPVTPEETTLTAEETADVVTEATPTEEVAQVIE